MSSKYIVVLHSPTTGFIIREKKDAILITGTDCSKTAKKMYKRAPKERVKAVFVYPKELIFQVYSKLVLALQDAGYDNISTLIASRFFFDKDKIDIGTIKSYNWFAFADNRSLVVQTCDIMVHVSYENEVQHFNIPYSEIPCKKTCEVVLQGTGDIKVSMNSSSFVFEPVAGIYNRKKEKYKVTIKISSTLVPDVRFEKILDYKEIESCVFCIEWNAKTKLFVGYHLDTFVVDDSKASLISSTNIKLVFDVLIKYKSDKKLLGVMVNYLGTNEFPLNVHREVIGALPTPTTKLIVGRIYAHYALNLKQSGIEIPKDHRRLIIVDWTMKPRISFVFLRNTDNGLVLYNETTISPMDNSAHILIITEKEPTQKERKKATEWFLMNRVWFSALSDIPHYMMLDYAWQYFNGLDFDGYMIECCKYAIWPLNDKIRHEFRTGGCYCPAFSCYNHFEINSKSATGLRAYFSENPHMFIKYAGFKKPTLYLQETKPNITVKTNVDDNLIPSATIPNANSLSVPDSIEALKVISVVVIIIPHGESYAAHFWQKNRQDTYIALDYDHAVSEIEYFLPLTNIKRIIDLTADNFTMRQRIAHHEQLKSLEVDITISHSLHFHAMKLYQHDVKVKIGESIVLLFETKTATIKKNESGFNCVDITYERKGINSIKCRCFLFHVAFVVKVDLNVMDDLYLIAHPKFLDLSATILTDKTRQEFINSVINDTNFHGYRIAEFDEVQFDVVSGDDSRITHALGVKNLPFEQTEEYDRWTSLLKVCATVKNEEFGVENYNVTDLNVRRIRLTIKQTNLCNITASLVLLEERDCFNTKTPIVNFVTPKEADVKSNTAENLSSTSSPMSKEFLQVVENARKIILEKYINDEPVYTDFHEANETPEILHLPSAETLQNAVDTDPTTILIPSPEVTFTFITNNRIRINAGPNYTGDSEFAAYFRMKTLKFGPIMIIGKKAKAAYKKHPKTVIYDIPGLLAADSNELNVNPTWTFDTSYTADDTLLIHLGNGAFTSPVPLFASVIQSALLHVKEHLTDDVKAVGIKLPEASLMSEENLIKVSSKLGVTLILI